VSGRRHGRLLPFFLLLCGSAAGAFGLDLSYGGGALIHFSPGTFRGTYSGTDSQVTNLVTLTTLQFIDATYVELHVGYTLMRGSTEPAAASTTTAFAVMLTGLSFGGAVKYPFMIGPVVIFPLLSVDYVMNLTYSDDKGDDLKQGLAGHRSGLNELWVRGGVGVDFSFGRFFLRPVLLVGFMPFQTGGVPTLSSTHATGSITLDRGIYSVDVNLLFGCRL
jgi:hypothetical protein